MRTPNCLALVALVSGFLAAYGCGGKNDTASSSRTGGEGGQKEDGGTEPTDPLGGEGGQGEGGTAGRGGYPSIDGGEGGNGGAVLEFTLEITTDTIPAGQLDRPYPEFALEVEGAAGNVFWTIPAGGGILPLGMSLQGGVLSGTPTTAGVFPIRVRVQDEEGNIGERSLTITIIRNPLILYLADQAVHTMNELYSVSTETEEPSTPEKVNGALPSDARVSSFKWAPDGKRVGYIANQDDDQLPELFLVDMAGDAPGDSQKANEILSPSLSEGVIDFEWSPDCQSLVYLAEEDDNDSTNEAGLEAWYVDVSGAQPGAGRRLHSVLPVSLPAQGGVSVLRWSSDSQKVALTGDLITINRSELFVVAPPGNAMSNRVNGDLESDGGLKTWSWSHSGRYILYRADEDLDGEEQDELFVVDVQHGVVGTRQSNVAKLSSFGDNTANSSVTQEAWAPNSTGIAYLADQFTDGANELFYVDVASLPDGPLPDPVRLNQRLATGDSSVVSFKWAPDSRSIAFLSDVETNDEFELFLADVSGNSRVEPLSGELVPDGDVESDYHWSPDSKWIAFRATKDSADVDELYIVNVETLGSTYEPVKISGNSVTGGNVTAHWRFSPDSKSLLYLADQNADEVNELYYVSLAGDEPAEAVKVNSSLVTGGNVSPQFWFSSSSQSFAYLADQETDEVNELFLVTLDDGVPNPSPTKINDALAENGMVAQFAWAP